MRGRPSKIVHIRVRALDAPMSEPFEIAGGSQAQVRNVLVEATLQDGSVGWGECAPFASFNGETQASTLRAVRAEGPALEGMDASAFEPIARRLERRLEGAARAGLEMAVLDAWARQRRIPLWIYFGGRGHTLATDITIPITAPPQAARAARRIWARGVGTIKIKVGRDLDEDFARVRAVSAAAPKAALILDANQGYSAKTALRLLRLLSGKGIRPALFEQPVSKDDWQGLAAVSKHGGIPVAADETVSSRGDAYRMARLKAASVINIKLMKYGIHEALDIARIARAAGLGLMIGGMIESYLAMGCAAHLAAGLGGFSFVDLDTPLWFARNPMRGLSLRPGGLYRLSGVRAGIGVRPR